jgi:plasmid stability protein
MKRITIYLPDDLKRALELTAATQGQSEAEVVRGALAVATADQEFPRPQVPLFDSGDPTLADRVDEELTAGPSGSSRRRLRPPRSAAASRGS